MTDTSKKAVEQEVCGPLIKYLGRHEAARIARTLVKERDNMSTALAFIANRGEDISKEAIETIARNALKNRGE